MTASGCRPDRRSPDNVRPVRAEWWRNVCSDRKPLQEFRWSDRMSGRIFHWSRRWHASLMLRIFKGFWVVTRHEARGFNFPVLQILSVQISMIPEHLSLGGKQSPTATLSSLSKYSRPNRSLRACAQERAKRTGHGSALWERVTDLIPLWHVA